jgi:hypothetical protein
MKEANEMESSNTTTTGNVFFSTQGRRTPHPLDTEKKGMSEVFNDYFGQKCQRHGSSENDKWDVLYSVYGRSNIRFGN